MARRTPACAPPRAGRSAYTLPRNFRSMGMPWPYSGHSPRPLTEYSNYVIQEAANLGLKCVPMDYLERQWANLDPTGCNISQEQYSLLGSSRSPTYRNVSRETFSLLESSRNSTGLDEFYRDAPEYLAHSTMNNQSEGIDGFIRDIPPYPAHSTRISDPYGRFARDIPYPYGHSTMWNASARAAQCARTPRQQKHSSLLLDNSQDVFRDLPMYQSTPKRCLTPRNVTLSPDFDDSNISGGSDEFFRDIPAYPGHSTPVRTLDARRQLIFNDTEPSMLDAVSITLIDESPAKPLYLVDLLRDSAFVAELLADTTDRDYPPAYNTTPKRTPRYNKYKWRRKCPQLPRRRLFD